MCQDVKTLAILAVIQPRGTGQGSVLSSRHEVTSYLAYHIAVGEEDSHTHLEYTYVFKVRRVGWESIGIGGGYLCFRDVPGYIVCKESGTGTRNTRHDRGTSPLRPGSLSICIGV